MNSRQKLQAALFLASQECIDKKHGNGNERIVSLRQYGFSDNQIVKIQRLVNSEMKLRRK